MHSSVPYLALGEPVMGRRFYQKVLNTIVPLTVASMAHRNDLRTVFSALPKR